MHRMMLVGVDIGIRSMSSVDMGSILCFRKGLIHLSMLQVGDKPSTFAATYGVVEDPYKW